MKSVETKTEPDLPQFISTLSHLTSALSNLSNRLDNHVHNQKTNYWKSCILHKKCKASVRFRALQNLRISKNDIYCNDKIFIHVLHHSEGFYYGACGTFQLNDSLKVL